MHWLSWNTCDKVIVCPIHQTMNCSSCLLTSKFNCFFSTLQHREIFNLGNFRYNSCLRLQQLSQIHSFSFLREGSSNFLVLCIGLLVSTFFHREFWLTLFFPILQGFYGQRLYNAPYG